jgi:hypothetical protein
MTDPDHDEKNRAARGKLIGAFPKLPRAQQEAVDATVFFEVLAELLRAIDAAFEQNSGEPPATPQTEQKRWAKVLLALGYFFSIIEQPHADQFFVLSDEFCDKADGLDPFTLRSSKTKKSSPSTRIAAARANVVFAVDVFIAVDMLSPEKAAKKVLNAFPDIKNLAGRKSHRPDYPWHKTILEWRKTLSAPCRQKNVNVRAAEISEAALGLIEFSIRTGRHAWLRERALGRLRKAADVGLNYCR